MRDIPRILFVGERNAVRSVMAHRMLAAKLHGRAQVCSAGCVAEGPHPLAVGVLREMAIDASDHSPKALGDIELLPVDLLVTFGPRARALCAPTLPTSDGGPGDDPAATIVSLLYPLHLHWDIPDPSEASASGGTLAAFRDARDLLATRLEWLLRCGLVEALESRRAQVRVRLDRSSLGLVAMDSKTRLFLFNAQAERLTGHSREDVLGRPCHKVFPPNGICGGACLFSNEGGCPAAEHEHLVGLSDPGGHARPLRVRVAPLREGAIPWRATVAILQEVNGALPPPARHFHGIVGRSRPILEAIALIRQVAWSDYPVLIMGESGTGKELAARAIHMESRRRGGPFVPVNCGALPEHLLESELFGHVRGAFTGAIRDKKGRFELADGGTLLLDEVGELSPSFQVKLLRVLQDKRFERVGGETQIAVDVRVIASTNRDLRALVRQGSFREDLFYRLAVVPLVLPPLRERMEDLPDLIAHILAELRKEGATLRRVSSAAMDLLRAYEWPGNVRELINALQYASVHCRGEEVLPEHLPFEISGLRPSLPVEVMESETPAETEAPAEESASLDAPRGGRVTLTPERVSEAIRLAGGNKLKAAKLLGIGRATLYRFLEKHASEVRHG